MKKLLLLASALAALAVSVHAGPISGTISFSGSAQLNTASANGATHVVANGFSNVVVGGGADGSFAGLAGSAVTMTTEQWNFDTILPIDAFWQVGGFTFDLLSSSIASQGGGFLNVSGLGILSGNGYSDTYGTWSFSTQGVGVTNKLFTFSSFTTATNAVPEGSTTALLLGLGLLVVGFVARRGAAVNA